MIDEIVEKIYNDFDFKQPPLQLGAAVMAAARDLYPGVPALELSEQLLDKKPRQKLVSAIIKKESSINEDGLYCKYEYLEKTDELVGFSYPRQGDSEYVVRLRRVAPIVPDARTAIRALEPIQFERFCTKLLYLLGAEDTLQTQYAKDGGLDFLGWGCISKTASDIVHIPFQQGFRVLLLGQSKRYTPNNPVGVDAIRELVGAAAAFHHDQLAPWESRFVLPKLTVMTPLLPVLMTTGRISRDARALADKCGVLTRDGSELAVFVCVESVGTLVTQVNGNEVITFSTNRFIEWLQQ